jgi:hypothetical protein
MSTTFELSSKNDQPLTVASKEAAWAAANKIFPTDYEKDYTSSERFGYDVYRHPTLNYYSRICDLGYKLEVLTGEYGENVTNIWIENRERQEMTVAKQAARYLIPVTIERVHKMIFTVTGYEHSLECEKRLYIALSRERSEAIIQAHNFVIAWCDRAGLKWESASITSFDHYSKATGGGHYFIGALVTERSEY